MTASVLPELWRAWRPRPDRPPIDWRGVRTIVALTVSGFGLAFAGVTLIGVGEPHLGYAMAACGVVLTVVAAQERW